MTATGNGTIRERREGALGAHSLDGYTVAVPDLKVAESFYAAFGLEVRNERNGLGLYTDHNSHRWGSVVEGPRKRLQHLNFGIFENDLPAFADHLSKLSIPRIDPPADGESNGIWFNDPSGIAIEIRVADKTTLSTKPVSKPLSVAPGMGAAPKRSEAGKVRPQRLSHLLLFSPDVLKSVDFYSRALGLRLSDRSGDIIAFMHAPHGGDHHLIAFAKSGGPGLHHSSWAVDSVHEVGLGAGRMAEHGHDKGWGVGRHVLGSNYFYYVRDPWGSYAEYSHDIDFIPVDVDWKAGDHAAEDSFYIWGPNPPADFVTNFELG